MVETAGTVVRAKTEGMAVTAVMLVQAPTQMAEMAALTEPMEGMVATEEAGTTHPVVMVVMAVIAVIAAAAYKS
ncbi:hypothetical protein [Pantoea agglomerans]|uniref:hypothetical protein n=1 Tax=Enterobacter agglomerans TaxID=549 RepID=UPI0013BEFA2D|nr:hypothetical protein [Pantoea agglomerans]NEG51701.1 hypothetical protein [Pantoea agglomerans]